MDSDDSRIITKLLQQLGGDGDTLAKERLYKVLYGQLSRVARNHLAKAGTVSLDAPAILHEAYLRIEAASPKARFVNRKAFFTYASMVMRTVIVDYLRERGALKRGASDRVTLNTGVGEIALDDGDLIKLYQAMSALERVDPRSHQVVEMRYFAGLTEDEIAEILCLSVPTVKRDWYKARAFLFDYLKDGA